MTPGDRPPVLPTEEELQAYVDSQLDANRQPEVDAYLALRPDVAHRMANLRAQRDALRAVFGGIAEEPVPDRLKLDQLIPASVPTVWSRWQLAAGMLLIFGGGVLTGWSAREVGVAPQAGIAALAQEATAGYSVYADDPARPVEMGADRRAELVRWVSDRIHRRVDVPDLSASGYRLIGGRLLPTEHGPAGMFLYEDGEGHRVAMVMRPMQVERNTPMIKGQRGRVAGYTWAHEGLGYSLVGADAPEVLHPLANEVQRQTAAESRAG
jgi:anti-sigma factor RsiW